MFLRQRPKKAIALPFHPKQSIKLKRLQAINHPAGLIKQQFNPARIPMSSLSQN